MNAVAFEQEPRTMSHNGVRVFRPIKLRSLLAVRAISHVDLAAAVKQKNGRALSRTALSFLMNYGEWPFKTPPESIKGQIENYLASRGVSPDELADIWQHDEIAQSALNHRNAHGAHAYPRRRDAVGDQELVDIPEKEMLTSAARKHFQLFRDPFLEDPRGPDELYLGTDQRYIREAMYVTAKNGGFVAVVGEVGAGKSALRKDLIDRVLKEGLQLVFIQPRAVDKKRLTARMICEAILDDVAPGTPPPQSLERLARRVEAVLVESYKAGNRHVLMIEEAQDLEPRALKHLKRFYEIELGFTKLLSIILLGQPELKELLDERRHFDLREVIRRCEVAELQPLDANVRDYLEVRFRNAGKKLEEIFEKDAFDAIVARLTRESTKGRLSMVYPLAVHIITTKAMNLAASMGEARISAEVVKEV